MPRSIHVPFAHQCTHLHFAMGINKVPYKFLNMRNDVTSNKEVYRYGRKRLFIMIGNCTLQNPVAGLISVNVDNLRHDLKNHPDSNFVVYLCHGLPHAFVTLISDTYVPTIECKNRRSAILQPNNVDKLIEGPFKELPFLLTCKSNWGCHR